MRDFLSAFVAQQRTALHVPALSAAIVLPDRSVVASASGWADPEAGIAATPATRFMSGSTGKTFCAALALSLVAEGKIHLDDKLAPLFAADAWFATLPNHDALTLRMLLHHAEGFPQFLDMNSFTLAYAWDTLRGRDVGYTPQHMLGFIANAAPLNAPGAEFHYSDLGFDLIGLTIEKLTGQPYMVALQERLLRPHGYSEIAPNLSTHVPGLAAGYARSSFLQNIFGLSGRVTRADGELKQNPSLEYAGGGLNLTPRALALFFHDLAAGQVLDAASTAQMMDSQIPISTAGGVTQAYGLGIFVTKRPGLGTYYSHSGYYPGFVTAVAYFKQSGIAVALQVNQDSADLAPVLRAVAEGVALRLK